MFGIDGLFETHLPVASLARSVAFYRDVLGLEMAGEFPERKVAFFWMGGRGSSMLGVWESGTGPQRMGLHVAFRLNLDDVLAAPERLKAAGVTPLDFWDGETAEPSVFAWMPAASVFFRDPDGHLLEFLAILDGPGQPEEGVVRWSDWRRRG